MPRYCFVSQVDPKHLVVYRERHAAVWSEMLRALRDAGWRNYSLHLGDDELLVGYFEADDAAAAQAAMDATAVKPAGKPRWPSCSKVTVHPTQAFATCPRCSTSTTSSRAPSRPTRIDHGTARCLKGSLAGRRHPWQAEKCTALVRRRTPRDRPALPGFLVARGRQG